MSADLVTFHAIVYAGTPETAELKKGPDHAANRSQLQTLMEAAGGYSSLTDAAKLVAAQWFLDDAPLTVAERRAQFLAEAKKGYTAAADAVTAQETAVTAAAAAVTDHTENVTETETAVDTALTNGTAIDGPALLATRNDARTAQQTAQTAADTKAAALVTAGDNVTTAQAAWDALYVDAKVAEIEAKQTEVDAKQAEVNADLNNQTLQDELTALQAALATLQEELVGLRNTETTTAAAQADVDAKQTEVDAKQTEVDAKQAEVDADPSNQTLQDALAALQAELSTAQTALAALQTTLTTVTDTATALSNAQAAQVTANQENNDAQTALTAATGATGLAEQAITTLARATQGRMFQSSARIVENVLNDLQLRHATATQKLAADVGNADLQAEVDGLASQITTKQAELTTEETKITHQRALQAAYDALTYYRNAKTSAEQGKTAADAKLVTLQAARDQVEAAAVAATGAVDGAAAWAKLAQQLEITWSDLYHYQMTLSRNRRYALGIGEVYRNLEAKATKELAAANNQRIMNLGDLYVKTGTKGKSENPDDQEGLFDYLRSHAGTSYENNGFAQDAAGYTIVTAGMTLQDIIDNVLYILRQGTHQ